MPARITIDDANIVAPPELRFGASGKGIANTRIAVNERKKNAATGEWEKGDATFITCVAFGQRAERMVEEDLKPGEAVTASGILKQRNWETKEGEKRSNYELILDSFGRDYKWVDDKKKSNGNRTGATSIPDSDEPPF